MPAFNSNVTYHLAQALRAHSPVAFMNHLVALYTDDLKSELTELELDHLSEHGLAIIANTSPFVGLGASIFKPEQDIRAMLTHLRESVLDPDSKLIAQAQGSLDAFERMRHNWIPVHLGSLTTEETFMQHERLVGEVLVTLLPIPAFLDPGSLEHVCELYRQQIFVLHVAGTGESNMDFRFMNAMMSAARAGVDIILVVQASEDSNWSRTQVDDLAQTISQPGSVVEIYYNDEESLVTDLLAIEAYEGLTPDLTSINRDELNDHDLEQNA